MQDFGSGDWHCITTTREQGAQPVLEFFKSHRVALDNKSRAALCTIKLSEKDVVYTRIHKTLHPVCCDVFREVADYRFFEEGADYKIVDETIVFA